MLPIDLARHPAHLGLGATAAAEPEFTGDPAWYGAYGERHVTDGAEGRLVSMFTFHEPWTTWEMHPKGHEVVVCIAGSMVLHQEHPDGSRSQVSLEPGQYAINGVAMPPSWTHILCSRKGVLAAFAQPTSRQR